MGLFSRKGDNVDVEKEGQEGQGQAGGGEDRLARLEANVERMSALMSNFVETMTAAQQQAKQAQAEPAPPPIQDVSDEEIEKALQEGRGAEHFRRLAEAAAARKLSEIQPLINQGISAIADLSHRAVAKRDAPYADQYREEIEKELSSLPPAVKANPTAYEQAWQYAYGKVLASHIEEIRTKEREAAIRQATDQPAETRRGAGGPRQVVKTEAGEEVEIPTLEELVDDPVTAQTILAKHGSPDAFAQRQGFKNWAEFAYDVLYGEVTPNAEQH